MAKAKPILVVTPKYGPTLDQSATKISAYLKKSLGNQYHVIVVSDINSDKTTFECFNDSKGLKDKDIAILIKEYETKSTREKKPQT